MKGKAGFGVGMVMGLLVGSRMGPEFYRRVTSGVTSVAENPRVRQSASSAGDRAAHAAKNVGTSAAQQVRHASTLVAHRFERHGGEVHSSAATNGSLGPDDQLR